MCFEVLFCMLFSYSKFNLNQSCASVAMRTADSTSTTPVLTQRSTGSYRGSKHITKSVFLVKQRSQQGTGEICEHMGKQGWWERVS